MTVLLIALVIAYIIYLLYNASGTTIPYLSSNNEKIPEHASRQTRVRSSTPGAVRAKPPAGATPNKTGTEPKTATTHCRDPKTGETSTLPANYRFAKRWIKEALIEEGLLDRVYKNNELSDASINEKVRVALSRFRELEKYQA